MSLVIVVRPKFDTATAFLFEWTRKLVPTYIDKYPETFKEFKEDASDDRTVQDFVDSAPKEGSLLYIHYDHGVYDKLFGAGKTVVFDESTINKLSGYIVYAFACESAKQLGVKAIQDGVKAYLGYKEIFGFVLSKSNYFGYIAVRPAIMLIEGKTTGEVYKEIKKELKSLVYTFYAEYKKTGSYDVYMAAVWAYKDYKGWTLLGNYNERFILE